MNLVRCRLFSHLTNSLWSNFCIEATLLQNFALTLWFFFGDFKSIIKALGAQDSFGVFSKFVSKDCSLLVLMSLAHMSCLVNVGSLSSVKCTIVFVDIILRGRICTMEPCLICSEVWILTHACLNAIASWSKTFWLGCKSPPLYSSSLFHACFVHGVNIIESLISFCKLSGVRRAAYWGWTLLLLDSSRLCETLRGHIILTMKSSIVLCKLASAWWHWSLRSYLRAVLLSIICCFCHLIEATTGSEGFASLRLIRVLPSLDHVHC